jgi:DNA (cytosine-5)-methyltransferase 1
MTPRIYYNEINKYCAHWLYNLQQQNLIPHGDIDTRDIRDVKPNDLRSYTQCHFFAGLGGWLQALRLAAVPDHRPLWTGSCPCQPFSAAGQRRGFADERHLWPAWFHLIRQCRPATILGEQTAGPDGLKWLDLVCSDLEGEGYAVGASDLCAAGVGAPHIRQRLWFVAKSASEQRRLSEHAGRTKGVEVVGSGEARELGNDKRRGCESGRVSSSESQAGFVAGANGASILEYAALDGRQQRRAEPSERRVERGCGESFWSAIEWLPCTDGKSRPTRPGLFPLAHGVPARVAKLRATGNAIIAQVAAEFIKAALE